MSEEFGSFSSMAAMGGVQVLQSARMYSRTLMATGTSISASSDPSTLITGGGVDAEMAGLESAISTNAQAINVANTAGAGLDQIANLLDQARSLISANSNSIIGDASKQANQSQIDSILKDINHIANTTNFNGQNLLDGSGQITSSGDALNINSATTSNLGQTEIDGREYDLSVLATGAGLDTTGPRLVDAAGVINQAIDEIALQQEMLGSFIGNTIEPTLEQMLSQRDDLVGSGLPIEDASEAMQVAAGIRNDLLGQDSLPITYGFDKQQHLQSLMLSVLG